MTSEYQFCAQCIKTKAIMATTETVSAFTIKCHFPADHGAIQMGITIMVFFNQSHQKSYLLWEVNWP